jgi:RimJ/RimL family protein N-acetyltransferase
MPQLTDRVLIQAILETDRPWAAYALADLEPGYCEQAMWFGAAAGVPALALLYHAFARPVLLTVGERNHAAIHVYEHLGFQTHCHYYEAIVCR